MYTYYIDTENENNENENKRRRHIIQEEADSNCKMNGLLRNNEERKEIIKKRERNKRTTSGITQNAETYRNKDTGPSRPTINTLTHLFLISKSKLK